MRALTLDGGELNQSWLPFAELADGAKLSFALAAEPDPAWGSAVEPPSFPPDAPFPGC